MDLGPKTGEETPENEAGMIIINAFPGLNPETLEVAAKNCSALLLIGHANGAIGQYLDNTVKKLVDAGKAVFVLSDNPGTNHGIVRYTDQPQITLREAGVIMLETVNVNNVQEVSVAIQNAIKEGLRGTQLAEFIRLKYSYAKDEKPISQLGTPEGLAVFHDQVKKITEGDVEN